MTKLEKRKPIERKISRESSRESSYQEYLTYSKKDLKNKLVQLVNLKLDTELAIEALTDALFSKGDPN